MADLGKKYECFNCATKFYNLGKPEAICPRCGANQKDAKSEEAPPPIPRPPRRSVIMEPAPEENPNEFSEEAPVPEEEAEPGEDEEVEEEPQIVEPDRRDEEEY